MNIHHIRREFYFSAFQNRNKEHVLKYGAAIIDYLQKQRMELLKSDKPYVVSSEDDFMVKNKVDIRQSTDGCPVWKMVQIRSQHYSNQYCRQQKLYSSYQNKPHEANHVKLVKAIECEIQAISYIMLDYENPNRLVKEEVADAVS